MSTSGRGWYLLLQVGVPSAFYDEDAARHIRVVGEGLGTAHAITIRQIDLEDKSFSRGHYLFRFPRYKRDHALASRLAEAFVYGMSLVHGPMVEIHHDSLVVRVPDTMVRSAGSIRVDALIELERSRCPEDRSLTFPSTALGTISSTSSDRHEAAWRIAALTLENNRLFDATRFLKRSLDNFYVYPGEIRKVLSVEGAVPRTSSHQSNSEDALQNAFKAIEAVIGDPPKDDRRFFEKLRGIGIDPLEEVGFDRKVTISALIRRMNEARDKCSAHGSTPPRLIRHAELLEFQACAEVVVLAALEKAGGTEFFA